jgi:hypothetical protein
MMVYGRIAVTTEAYGYSRQVVVKGKIATMADNTQSRPTTAASKARRLASRFRSSQTTVARTVRGLTPGRRRHTFAPLGKSRVAHPLPGVFAPAVDKDTMELPTCISKIC